MSVSPFAYLRSHLLSLSLPTHRSVILQRAVRSQPGPLLRYRLSSLPFGFMLPLMASILLFLRYWFSLLPVGSIPDLNFSLRIALCADLVFCSASSPIFRQHTSSEPLDLLLLLTFVLSPSSSQHWNALEQLNRVMGVTVRDWIQSDGFGVGLLLSGYGFSCISTVRNDLILSRSYRFLFWPLMDCFEWHQN